ncbi:MAG: DNA polymerase III subunit epsilon [Ghiorsea sp.]|nr:DNA polymerase III subunit epsilon [Ghiorsea sp.]
MRLMMLDTETTGLSPQQGDRMVEIGVVEVCNRDMSQTRTFHQYINPGRKIPAEVVRIHGIDDARVKDEPSFADIAQDFLDFIKGGTLVIHNAPFDLGFIMNELEACNMPNLHDMPVIDTLAMAKKQFPRQRNNLNALCDRFEIGRGHRELHGALLDSELLGEVYLAMTGGKQFSLGMDTGVKPASEYVQLPSAQRERTEQRETAELMRRAPIKIREEDKSRHQTMMQRIAKESDQHVLWREE